MKHVLQPLRLGSYLGSVVKLSKKNFKKKFPKLQNVVKKYLLAKFSLWGWVFYLVKRKFFTKYIT